MLHRASGRSGLGFSLALATMLLWGVLALALKITLTEMDAYTITWYRFLVSTVLLGAVLASRGQLPAVGRLSRHVQGLLVVATTFLAANYILFLLGLQHTTPANTQVLIQLAPLLLAVGGLGVFGERFTRLQWLGFVVLLLGLAVFFRDQLTFAGSALREYRLGSVLVLLAAVTWAIYGLAQKQLLTALPSQSIMLCLYAGCTVLFAPLSTPSQLLGMDRLGLGMLLFCSLNTVIAYGTFAEALVHWDASRVAAVLALTPLATIASAAVAGALWPSLAVTARISGAGFVGVGMVVAGALLTALGGRAAFRAADLEADAA
jgi:drug/metabolite transporter (DMT)-like permease